MENISFNDGYKEYTINNDESKIIRFNPSDFNIVDRVATAINAITDIVKDMKNQNICLNNDGTVDADSVTDLQHAGKIVSNTDKKIREQIDFILGSPICETAFGKQSCMSLVGGVPLYERFLNVITPIIRKDVLAEKKASQKRVEKYTKGAK